MASGFAPAAGYPRSRSISISSLSGRPRAGVPVILATGYCGLCQDDHGNPWKPQNASLKSRIDYLYSPKGLAFREYMHYVRKFFPKDAAGLSIRLWMKTLFPFLWEIKSKIGKE